MGAWGLSPFDSDGALDFLGDLADKHAKTDDNHDIVPASIDHHGVHAALTKALQAVCQPATPNEYRSATIDDAYASAGLVAAALTPNLGQPRGTSLFAGGDRDGLDLTRHCGYLAVLNSTQALALAPAAVAAVAAIKTETEWVERWSDPDAIHARLDALTELLVPHTS